MSCHVKVFHPSLHTWKMQSLSGIEAYKLPHFGDMILLLTSWMPWLTHYLLPPITMHPNMPLNNDSLCLNKCLIDCLIWRGCCQQYLFQCIIEIVGWISCATGSSLLLYLSVSGQWISSFGCRDKHYWVSPLNLLAEAYLGGLNFILFVICF